MFLARGGRKETRPDPEEAGGLLTSLANKEGEKGTTFPTWSREGGVKKRGGGVNQRFHP